MLTKVEGKCAKNRIKYTNAPDFFECMHLC